MGVKYFRLQYHSAIYWTSVELLKSEVLSTLDKQDTNFAISLCIGAFSGSVSAVCTLPFDVVKTHRQIQLGDLEAYGQKRASFSTWRSLACLWKQHGIQSLFTGIVPRLVKVAPACAIMIATYDYGKLMFERRNMSVFIGPCCAHAPKILSIIVMYRDHRTNRYSERFGKDASLSCQHCNLTLKII
ncbi:hypothetical protein D918_05599 [Trichuris suis]|nr:hypothetical protein D918_05599 [Trichuris suis]